MENVIGKQYGYIRVSTKEQNEDRQIIALSDYGIELSDVYIDKRSGKDFKRPQYRRLLAKLKSGDTVVVTSIDRLGRNYNEILEQWRHITKKLQCDIVVLDMPLLDTRRSNDLTGTLIADIVLQLLSYVAQTERENIKKRQAEGISAAKARGVKFGRPEKELPNEFIKVYGAWKNRELTARAAAEQCNMPVSTFYYKAKRLNIY